MKAKLFLVFLLVTCLMLAFPAAALAQSSLPAEPPKINWTADGLIAASGVAISLIFAYFPGVKDWFDKLDPRKKPLLNLIALAAMDVGYLLVSCNFDLQLITQKLPEAGAVLLAALIANMTTFTYAVKQVKKAKGLQARLDSVSGYRE